MPSFSRTSSSRLVVFEGHRHELVALAYRMLGDMARAEDMVQEAWVRWQESDAEPDSPKAFLVTIVTRLCLNELASARVRHEESRSDRLPEPVDLDEKGLSRIEELEQVSMAFLVLLQRLSPAERAVLLLHDVFEFEHAEIARLVGGTTAGCRKLLERARQHVASGRRMMLTPEHEHRRLLKAFIEAATEGNIQGLVDHLADDAIMITDGGVHGRAVGGQRNLRQPLQGAARIATFVVTATARGSRLEIEEHPLNGQPAIIFRDQGRPFAALLLAVADGKIQRVFFHADLDRLRYLGARDQCGSGLS